MTKWFVLFLLLAASGLCLAQSESATLSGRVSDPSGAAVIGADVVLTNTQTNVEQRTKTNEVGLYVFPGVHPGAYRVAAGAPGFRVLIKEGLTLHVQDELAENFSLTLGAISESITVTADQNNINTTDASVSTVIDQSYVKNMPLNGRSFQDLILLTPGVVTQSPQTGAQLGQQGEFSVNGQRTESNGYTVDGVSANVGATGGINMVSGAGPSGSLAASTALGTTQALVSVDDLQEFRVQSSSYSAEYGRNPGGQFAFETKSGANQWHGTVYDYLRNGFFDANDWFNDYFHVAEPALRQNDFGGTFGGPVEVPGLYHGKDKTFFFVSYEGLRLTSPQPASTSYVPDLCMRGVVAQCPTSGPGAGRTPAASALLPVMNAFPLPSPKGLEDATNGFGQFIGSWSNPGSLDSTSVRFDHVVNDKLRLFFRFSDTTSSSATRFQSSIVPPSVDNISTYEMRTYTAGASSVFTNRLSNDFRFNYSSNGVTDTSVIDALGGSTPVKLVQLTGLGAGSNPTVYLDYGGYALNFFQQQNLGSQKQWNLVDTIGLSMGRHHFKFGVDYRRLAPFEAATSPSVLYLYLSESSVEANSATTIFENYGPGHPLYTNFSAFAQDEWRVSSRLNLSLGLRWEVNPPPGVTQGLGPYTIEGTGPNNWAVAPQGTPLWKTTWYNLAPRLGVAYTVRATPGWETVVRGGGGVFFDTGQQTGSYGFNGVGFLAYTFGSGPFPGSPAGQIPPIVNPPVAPYNSTPFGFASHLQLPYTLQWNASVEQALGKSQALTVAYVGSHASRLLQEVEVAPANNPNGSVFVFFENGLTSDYDSLQIQFQRRLIQGLTALASYTWSHCLDYGSLNYDFGYQRGDCDFDVRNNLSTAFSYDLPNVGHNGFVNTMLHHWGLDDRFTARTAFPVTLAGNYILQPNGQFYHGGLDLVAGQPVYLYGANCASVLQGLGDLQPGQGCPGGRAINPNAFTAVNSGLGNAPRNFARGFDAVQIDLAVRRDFPIHERLKLQFRAEAFNIFNHPNFGAINPSFGQSTFGQATGTLASSLGVLSPLYQMGGPRSMQFALKLSF